jgi:hypothetical protein
MQIREGWLIEQAWVHYAVLGQVVDDGFHKANLISAKVAALEILGKGNFCGVTV